MNILTFRTKHYAEQIAKNILAKEIDKRVEEAIEADKPVNPEKIYKELLIDPILSEHKRIGGTDGTD